MPKGHYDRSKAKPRRQKSSANSGSNGGGSNGSLEALADDVARSRVKLKNAVTAEIARLTKQLEAARAMAKGL